MTCHPLLTVCFPQKPDITLTLVGVYDEQSSALSGLVLDGKRKQDVFPVDLSVLTDVFQAKLEPGLQPGESLISIRPLPKKIRITKRKPFYAHGGKLWGVKKVSMEGQFIGKKLFITLHLVNKNEHGEHVEDSFSIESPAVFSDALYKKVFG
jgi:hypothetical protein